MKIILIIFGLIYLIFGVTILFKKICIHRLYQQLLLWLFFTISILGKAIISLSSFKNLTVYFLLAASLLLIYIFVSIHKYAIYKIDIDDVKKIILTFLDDNEIKYELKGEEIVLNEMGEKILLDDQFDGVEINLKAIKKTDLYYKIIKNIKKEIADIPSKEFSFVSIFYILLGIILISIGL